MEPALKRFLGDLALEPGRYRVRGRLRLPNGRGREVFEYRLEVEPGGESDVDLLRRIREEIHASRMDPRSLAREIVKLIGVIPAAPAAQAEAPAMPAEAPKIAVDDVVAMLEVLIRQQRAATAPAAAAPRPAPAPPPRTDPPASAAGTAA